MQTKNWQWMTKITNGLIEINVQYFKKLSSPARQDVLPTISLRILKNLTLDTYTSQTHYSDSLADSPAILPI